MLKAKKIFGMFVFLAILLFSLSTSNAANTYCEITLTPDAGNLTDESELEIFVDSDYEFEATEKLIVDVYVKGESKRSATKTMKIKESQIFSFYDLNKFANDKGIELDGKEITLVTYLKNGEDTMFGTKFGPYIVGEPVEEYCEITLRPNTGKINDETEFEINVDSNCDFDSAEKLIVDVYVKGESKRSATKTMKIKESQTFSFYDLNKFASDKGINLAGEEVTFVTYIKNDEETRFGKKFSGYSVEEDIIEVDDNPEHEEIDEDFFFEEEQDPNIEDEFKLIDGIVEVYSSSYSRRSNEADDTGKIQRAIDDIFANKGGILIIDEKLLINGTVNIVPNGHYPLEIRSAEADSMRYFVPLKADYLHNEFKYTIERTKPGIVFNVNYDGDTQIHKGAWSNFKFHNLHFKNGTLKNDNTFAVTDMTGFYQMKSSGTYENISFYGFAKGIEQPSLDSFGNSNYCDFNIFRNIYFELLSDVGITVYNNDCGKFENIIAPNSYKTVKNILRIIKSPAVSIENVFFGTWSTYDNKVSDSEEKAIIYSNLSTISIDNIGAEHVYLPPIYALNSTIDCDIIRTKYQVEYFFKNIGSILTVNNIKATAFERKAEYDYFIDNSKQSRTVIDNWDIVDKSENKVEMKHAPSSMPNKIYREAIIKVICNNGNVAVTDIFGNDCKNILDNKNIIISDNKVVFGKLKTGDEIKAVFLEKVFSENGENIELYSLTPFTVQLSNGNNVMFFAKIIY